MTGVVASFPTLTLARLQVGDTFSPRVLSTLEGSPVQVPDERSHVHLQLRRYAGCPICSLHLRSFARRKDELDSAGVREVVVFHSSVEELRKVHTHLPFAVVADPARQLYRELGLSTSLRALLDPRAWPAMTRAAAMGTSVDPRAGIADGALGLPGDFLIAPNGRVIALKYGVHANDQWSLDELLAFARGGS
jgi:peroxiredoxin